MAPQARTLKARLKALLSKGHFSILLGAGASVCAGYPLMSHLTEQVLTKLPREELPLLHDVWASLSTQPSANIETVLSQLYQILAVAEATPSLANVEYEEVQRCITAIQESVANTFVPVHESLSHRRLVVQMCRLNRRGPAVIATTNYDQLVENSCDFEQTLCLDGFSGTRQRNWVPELLPLVVGNVGPDRRFTHYPKAIRLLKLHGSISWATDGQIVVSFPDGQLPTNGTWLRRLIFPTPRKITESFSEPYSSLLRRLATLIDRQNGLLVTLGFSYRDQHLVDSIIQFVSRLDHTLVALVQQPEEALRELLGRPNVICVTEDCAWLDGKHQTESMEIWELPNLVEFLETL